MKNDFTTFVNLKGDGNMKLESFTNSTFVFDLIADKMATNYLHLVTELFSSKFTVFVQIAALVGLCYYFLSKAAKRRAKIVKHINEFPGPRPLPYIGNVYGMLEKFLRKDAFDWLQEQCKLYGGTIRMWNFSQPILFVATLDHALEILSNSAFLNKSSFVNLMWNLPGIHGLLSAPPDVSQPRRKKLLPGFSKQSVERSLYIVAEEIQHFTIQLDRFAQTGETFDIENTLKLTTFRAICRAAFGDDQLLATTETEAKRVTQALHRINYSIAKRSITPYIWERLSYIFYKWMGEGRQLEKDISVLKEFAGKAIKTRRQQNKSNQDETPRCYLDLLLKIATEEGAVKLTEIDMIGELNNFILAGYETSALTVGYTLFLLAKYPEHQQKVADEVEQIFSANGDSNRAELNYSEIDASHVRQLKYVELCVKEALRLFSTAPGLPRTAHVDVKLSDGRVIPAGTDTIIMVSVMHKDPRYFSKSEEFVPERHLDPNPAFMPFGLGPRRCAGQVYSMYNVKLEVACLVKEFIWETTDEEQGLASVTSFVLTPKNGLHFKIRRRNT